MLTDRELKVYSYYIGEYGSSVQDEDYIKIWLRPDSSVSMIVGFRARVPRWMIKSHQLGASLKIVGDRTYDESDSGFDTVSKEKFMEYLESTNKDHYEWILWNLEVLDGKYHAASEGQRLNNLSNAE